MKETSIDAADVTRKAMLGVDAGWYDACWNSDRPARKPRVLIRVFRLIAARARHITWPARWKPPTTAILLPQALPLNAPYGPDRRA
jgi:hypothetical protein